MKSILSAICVVSIGLVEFAAMTGCGSGQPGRSDAERCLAAAEDPNACEQAKRQWQANAGHTGSVSVIASSPAEPITATGGWDMTIRLWNTETGEQIRVLKGHENWIRAIAFSPDGKLLASSDLDGTILLWNTVTGELLKKTGSPDIPGLALAFSPDGLSVNSLASTGHLQSWDVNSGEKKNEARNPDVLMLTSGAITRNGQVAVGVVFGSLVFLDAKSGEVIGGLEVSQSSMNNVVALANDDKYLACSSDEDVHVWDLAARQFLCTLKRHSDSVTALAFSPDGKLLLSGGQDRKAVLWDVLAGRAVQEFVGHAAVITGVGFTSGSGLAITSSTISDLRLWKTADGSLAGRLGGVAAIEGAAFVPETRQIIAGYYDGAVRKWDMDSGKVVSTAGVTCTSLCSMSASADGKLLAFGLQDKPLVIWDVATQTEKLRIAQKSTPLWTSFAQDGQHIVTVGRNDDLCVWSLPEGNLEWTLKGHTDTVNSAVFSDDGTRLLSTSSDKTARLWNLKMGTEIRALKHEGSVECGVFLSDGKSVLTADLDNHVQRWDMDTGNVSLQFDGAPETVFSLYVVPQGDSFYGACHNGTVCRWNVSTGKLIATLEGHEGSARCAAMSADGKQLLTFSADKSVRLWNIDTRKEEMVFYTGNSLTEDANVHVSPALEPL